MNDLHKKQLVIIGIGNIGRILLERLRAAGVQPDHLAVCETDPARAAAAVEKFGVRTVLLADEAACAADLYLITTRSDQKGVVF